MIQDYGFRLYNPAIGKFLSVDPLMEKYPFYTPYQFASNTPICAIDIDGLESDVIWNAVEQPFVSDNSQGMRQTIEGEINNMQNNGMFVRDAEKALAAYNATVANIAWARKSGYFFRSMPTAANNLQYFLNGSGGTKIEDLGVLSKDIGFRSADLKLNIYASNFVLEQIKKGVMEGVVTNNEYAASVSPNTYDMYYASGKSYIHGNISAKLTKVDENTVKAEITIYKTWVDTYDWHPGLAARYTDVDDEGMQMLEMYGAREFEQRSYYKTTTTQYYSEGLLRWGVDLNYGSQSSTNQQVEKDFRFYDVESSNGWEGN